MSAYRLFWELLKHILHGRGRDEVCTAIDWETPDSYGGITGTVVAFRWESDRDAFCMIEAASSDRPWSDSNAPGPVLIGGTDG